MASWAGACGAPLAVTCLARPAGARRATSVRIDATGAWRRVEEWSGSCDAFPCSWHPRGSEIRHPADLPRALLAEGSPEARCRVRQLCVQRAEVASPPHRPRHRHVRQVGLGCRVPARRGESRRVHGQVPAAPAPARHDRPRPRNRPGLLKQEGSSADRSRRLGATGDRWRTSRPEGGRLPPPHTSRGRSAPF